MQLKIRADISTERAKVLAAIEAAAEAARGKIITLTAGQAATYAAKEAEAMLALADPDVDAAELPNLTLEAARTGEPVSQVAEKIIARAKACRVSLALIEAIRLDAKAAARNATDVHTLRNCAIWPS